MAADSVAGGEWNMKAEEEAAMEQAALMEMLGDMGATSPPVPASPQLARELGAG